MALGINTNLASLSAQRALNNTQGDTNVAMQRLSTGLRINSAKDDAAGMAVASRFTSQISGMQQASRNASDAVSMLQTAEGGLESITDNLQRIRELAVQAASDSISATDRGFLNTEVQQLVTEIDRVADTTKFNGTSLLKGDYKTAGSGLTFQVGADNTTNDRMEVTIADFNKDQLGLSQSASTGALTIGGTASTGEVKISVNGAAAVDIGAVSGNGLANQYKTAVDAVSGVTATVGSSVTAATGIAAFVANSSGGATTTNYQLEILLDGVASDIIASTTAAKTQSDIDSAITAFVGNDANLSVAGTAAGSNIVITDTSGRDITLRATITQGAGAAAGNGSGGLITGTASGVETTKVFGSLTIASDDGSSFAFSGTDETRIGATNNQSVASSGAASTGVDQIKVSSQADARTAIDIVDRALGDVNSGRATMGAFQSRFESVVSNLNLGAENATAGRSRVQDADFAVESANLAKNQVLQQAGMSVLAQANALPQQVLALLQ